jgi:SSS family solute:Na+ symporter
MHRADWAVIAGYCALALAIGIYFSKRASKNVGEFFIAGRNLPWWIAGTSIVATTFAADTPLMVSGLVRTQGIWGNWLWWNVLMGNMFATFFYARLWRRANILTDVELIELRYTGKPASILRGSLALYHSVLRNCITMSWVILAMVKISQEFLPWPKEVIVPAALGLVLSYSVLSGFWGVVMTDFVQFIIAMAGSVTLAAIAMARVGGMAALKGKLAAMPGYAPETLSLVPQIGAGQLALFTFVVYISVQWWATGAAEGGGYIAQRLFSTKDERHSVLASLWFTFAHYALRPWPWIVVGVISLWVFPNLPAAEAESAYPKMLMEFLPVGLRGMMIASLFAAFMSTMDTQLNWGASYLINDFYRRFIKKDASDRHYVLASRIAMIMIAVIGGVLAYRSESIADLWRFLFTLTSGMGLVMLLRWYWWRINAWSEISALFTGCIVATVLELHPDFTGAEQYALRLVITLVVSTAVWVTVTFLTSPVPAEQLKEFYRRVRPGAGWWGPIIRQLPEVHVERRGWRDFRSWISGVVCVYCAMFGIGKLVLGEYLYGILFLIIGAVAAAVVLRSVGTGQSRANSRES